MLSTTNMRMPVVWPAYKSVLKSIKKIKNHLQVFQPNYHSKRAELLRQLLVPSLYPLPLRLLPFLSAKNEKFTKGHVPATTPPHSPLPGPSKDTTTMSKWLDRWQPSPSTSKVPQPMIVKKNEKEFRHTMYVQRKGVKAAYPPLHQLHSHVTKLKPNPKLTPFSYTLITVWELNAEKPHVSINFFSPQFSKNLLLS